MEKLGQDELLLIMQQLDVQSVLTMALFVNKEISVHLDNLRFDLKRFFLMDGFAGINRMNIVIDDGKQSRHLFPIMYNSYSHLINESNYSLIVRKLIVSAALPNDEIQKIFMNSIRNTDHYDIRASDLQTLFYICHNDNCDMLNFFLIRFFVNDRSLKRLFWTACVHGSLSCIEHLVNFNPNLIQEVMQDDSVVYDMIMNIENPYVKKNASVIDTLKVLVKMSDNGFPKINIHAFEDKYIQKCLIDRSGTADSKFMNTYLELASYLIELGNRGFGPYANGYVERYEELALLFNKS